MSALATIPSMGVTIYEILYPFRSWMFCVLLRANLSHINKFLT